MPNVYLGVYRGRTEEVALDYPITVLSDDVDASWDSLTIPATTAIKEAMREDGSVRVRVFPETTVLLDRGPDADGSGGGYTEPFAAETPEYIWEKPGAVIYYKTR